MDYVISAVVSCSSLVIVAIVIYMVYFTKVDCELSEWKKWSECDKECDGGKQTRTRTIIKDSKNGGKECGNLKETKKCNTNPCPIDCKLSDWSEWSECDKECEGGQKKRTRTILEEPRNGGKKCEALEEIERCNDNVCGSRLTPPELNTCRDYIVYNIPVGDRETPILKMQNEGDILKEFCKTELRAVDIVYCAKNPDETFCKFISKNISRDDFDNFCLSKQNSRDKEEYKKQCDYLKMFY